MNAAALKVAQALLEKAQAEGRVRTHRRDLPHNDRSIHWDTEPRTTRPKGAYHRVQDQKL